MSDFLKNSHLHPRNLWIALMRASGAIIPHFPMKCHYFPGELSDRQALKATTRRRYKQQKLLVQYLHRFLYEIYIVFDSGNSCYRLGIRGLCMECWRTYPYIIGNSRHSAPLRDNKARRCVNDLPFGLCFKTARYPCLSITFCIGSSLRGIGIFYLSIKTDSPNVASVEP